MRGIGHLKTLAAVLAMSPVLAMSTVLVTPLSAQTLYGASNGLVTGAGLSDLYTIDPATGVATMVGPIGFENVTGLACLPDGRLVASTRGDALVPPGPSAILIEIDRVTGAGTLIGTIDDLAGGGNCGRMPDLTYDAVTGNLFGYSDFCNTGFEGLYTVDPVTGAGTSVGPSGFGGGGNGLAAEPGTGTLYATPFDTGSLVVIDPNTGAGTDVPGSVGNVPARVNGLTFHPATGVLYGSFHNQPMSVTDLVTIDTANGTTTTVGQTTLGLDAIVFDCQAVAPPTSIVAIPTLSVAGLALLALLVMAAAWTVLRRRRA